MADGKSYFEVQMVGWGGQGLVSAARILAQAAGLYDGKNITQTESHGISQRGGMSETEVIISDDEIDYPYVSHPDVLLALTQKECIDYMGGVKDGGIIIADTLKVTDLPPTKARVYRLPLLEIAREAGAEIAANMVALAVISSLSGAVSFGALEKTIEEQMPERFKSVNAAALKAGWEAAEKAKTGG